VVTPGELLGEFVEIVREGRPSALATVIEGPGRTGGRLLIDRTGILNGSLGDATLDGTVVERAAELLGRGTSEVVEIGALRVFIEVHLPPPRLVMGQLHRFKRFLTRTLYSNRPDGFGGIDHCL
jgi:xanthine dehydrogenase accessory factor